MVGSHCDRAALLMVKTMNSISVNSCESIVEMHCCTTGDHVYIGAAKHFETFGDVVGNSHGTGADMEPLIET